ATVKKAKEGKPNILLEAHMDEIGFVVQTIDDDGFLHIGKVGGNDLRVLLGSEVTVFGKEPLYGIFCCRPPHLSSRDDYKKVPELDELAIDIGLSHDKAVEKVKPGDYITLRQVPAGILNGAMTGKALDNRAGVAVVLRCLELCAAKIDCGLCAAFTLSEELGCRGAVTAAYSAAPTHAIVVDVSFGYTPDAPREKCGDLGKGPMIGVSPTLSGEVTSMLFELAKEKNIPYQTEVMGGETGTNADSVSISRGGVATGLVSVPLRYMHTAAEVIAVADVEYTAQLMAAAVERIGGGADD
ncbi:MAG TPA: M42 family peptidase, partial [Ruminiclostridium sp.]|nr:M42 family peptidase [Ruminiclostridium sp.]